MLKAIGCGGHRDGNGSRCQLPDPPDPLAIQTFLGADRLEDGCAAQKQLLTSGVSALAALAIESIRSILTAAQRITALRAAVSRAAWRLFHDPLPLKSLSMSGSTPASNLADATSANDQLLEQALALVRSRCPIIPEVAIILGSGLGGLADEIQSPIAIDYHDIPGFARSTASGHRGQLILGTIAGRPVVAMAGRFHRYEGYRDNEVTFPVQLQASLGARTLIVSNAAGALATELQVGDIVVITDHIDLAKTASPLCFLANTPSSTAPNQPLHDRLQVVQNESLYDPELIQVALAAARQAGFHAQMGVYLATSGPTYETRAEYRMQRIFGADVVGMSTAPEVRVANRCGMRVLALSMVSNVARPDCPEPANHDEVLAAGRAAAHKLRAIVQATLAH